MSDVIFNGAQARFIYERINRLVTKRATPLDFYTEQFAKRFRTLLDKLVVIDLVTPIADIIRGYAWGGRQAQFLRCEELEPRVQQILTELVRSSNWNSIWPNAIFSMLCYGKAVIRIYWDGERQRPYLWLAPYDTVTVTNPTTGELVRVYGNYGEIAGSFNLTIDEIVDDYWVDSQNAEHAVQRNTLGFIPAVVVRSPSGASLDWPIPIVAPALEMSHVATLLTNDVTILAHLQGFAVLKVTKADSIIGEREIAVDTAIVLPGDADANYISPDAKISEIDAIIDKCFSRAAVMCGLPADVVRYDAGISGSSATSAQKRYAPAMHAATKIRNAIIAAMRDAVTMVGAIASGRSLEDVRQAVSFEISFEDDVIGPLTVQEVEAYRKAVEYGFIDFSDARRYFNIDEPNEDVQDAESRFWNVVSEQDFGSIVNESMNLQGQTEPQTQEV